MRVLNLNYNFVEDPRPLEGLTRLRKLTLIGSRVKHARLLVRVLRGMTDIEMLDFRYAPSIYLRALCVFCPSILRGAAVPGFRSSCLGASLPPVRRCMTRRANSVVAVWGVWCVSNLVRILPPACRHDPSPRRAQPALAPAQRATVRCPGLGGLAHPGAIQAARRNFSSILTECVHRIADKLARACGCAAALCLFCVQCRMNPSTLGWYLPLLVRDVPGALQPSDGDLPNALAPSRGAASQVGAVPTPRIQSGQRSRGGPSSHGAPQEQGSSSTSARSASGAISADAEAAGASGGHGATPARPPAGAGATVSAAGAATWKELDAKFRRDLPDEAYVGRLAYRGLVMRACPAIRLLDGIETSAKEREKAEKLLASLGLGRDRVRGTGASAGGPVSAGGTPTVGEAAGGLTREKEKTREGPRARAQ